MARGEAPTAGVSVERLAETLHNTFHCGDEIWDRELENAQFHDEWRACARVACEILKGKVVVDLDAARDALTDCAAYHFSQASLEEQSADTRAIVDAAIVGAVDVASRDAEIAMLQQLVADFKAAAMLDVGSDPDGVTPAHVEREITKLRADVEALRKALGSAVRSREIAWNALDELACPDGATAAQMKATARKARDESAESATLSAAVGAKEEKL
jgi:hypothetical protein